MQNCVESSSLAHVALSASWQSGDATHTDIRHFEKFNAWRDLDLLPAILQRAILGQHSGHRESHPFAAGELVAAWQQQQLLEVDSRQVDFRLSSGLQLTPRTGRFYPRGILHGLADTFSGDMRPVRYLGCNGDNLRFDLNHPLARYPIEIGVEILDVLPGHDEHGGRCVEVVRELMHGPGMQVPCPGTSTDFLSGEPFLRLDESSDEMFYSTPRLVHHLDAAARERVAALYGRLIKPGSRVLDLMSSWVSHLPDTLEPLQLSGLGMNEQELASNKRLDDYCRHDLNESPQLPYPSDNFDVVICTASVEYLVDPLAVFRNVARTLRPGGLFINVFSNRWFPPKAVAIWSELHEFERPGLVSDYYRLSGQFTDLHSYSERGLARPEDDPHIQKTSLSDPVHAVWASKIAR